MGANAPGDSGLYFSWGNTDGHEEGSGYDFSQDTYDTTAAAAIESNLSLEHDMARAHLGEPWLLPSKEDFQELFDNCTSVWTTQYGVNGILFTSNVNGNTIFIPAAGFYNGKLLTNRGLHGFYWSSSYDSHTNAYNLYFGGSSVNPKDNSSRRLGYSVRAVLKDKA